MYMKKGKFVGFGLGPIQAGLFLYEAHCSGNFNSLVVAEVDNELVEAVNSNNGVISINIAFRDHIQKVEISGVRLLNPNRKGHREELIRAISEADELSTSLPSVSFYNKGGTSSVAACLAEGFVKRKKLHPAIIYTAENNNHAAEILQDEVETIGGQVFPEIQFLNTVIGKMSSVVEDDTMIERYGLAPLSKYTRKTILVETFNRILITKIVLPGIKRRIDVFEEKENLLPFEEAKLFGHNAIHLLLGLLAHARGCKTIAEVKKHTDLLDIARKAFIEEAGVGLIHKNEGIDLLFTSEGINVYAEDLLDRMTNPFLSDPISRVIRDLNRKIAWNDRLIGSARLAMNAGVSPDNLLKGIHLAELYILNDTLKEIWTPEVWCSSESEYFKPHIDLINRNKNQINNTLI